MTAPAGPLCPTCCHPLARHAEFGCWERITLYGREVTCPCDHEPEEEHLMTDPYADNAPTALTRPTEPLTPTELEEPYDGALVRDFYGDVVHRIPNAPRRPYLFWTGEMRPGAAEFIAQGNGPYWTEGRNLVLARDTAAEDTLTVHPGEWVTCLGAGNGWGKGVVMPVHMRIGWEANEYQVGHIGDPADLPAFLRSIADEWEATGELKPDAGPLPPMGPDWVAAHPPIVHAAGRGSGLPACGEPPGAPTADYLGGEEYTCKACFEALTAKLTAAGPLPPPDPDWVADHPKGSSIDPNAEVYRCQACHAPLPPIPGDNP